MSEKASNPVLTVLAPTALSRTTSRTISSKQAALSWNCRTTQARLPQNRRYTAAKDTV